MSNVDLKLLIAISRVHSSIFKKIEESLKEYDLSVSEFGVLEFLLHRGEQPIQVIAEKILVTSGSITYILNQLMQKDLVSRERCSVDKRKFYIRLTASGTALISDIFPKHVAIIEELFKPLGEEVKVNLVSELFQLNNSIKES